MLMRTDESAASINFPLLDDQIINFSNSRLEFPRHVEMILPASAQILLHSSVLIWTAYYLMFKPFVILDSTLVVIFGHALHLVFILITAVCLILAAVLSNPVLGPWSHIFWSTIAVSRHCRYNPSFPTRLDLLSCHEYFPRGFPFPRCETDDQRRYEFP